MSSQAYRWCFTAHKWKGSDIDESDDTAKDVDDILKQVAKSYIFQLEKGDQTSRLHYQGYISLKKKLRLSQVKKIIPQAHWEVAKGKDDVAAQYCNKTDTRIKGPWGNHKCMKAIETANEREACIQARRTRLRQRLTPEMQNIHQRMKMSIMTARPGEHVIVYVDQEGGKGKSTFIDLAECKDPDYMPTWTFISATAGGADDTAFKQQLGSKLSKLKKAEDHDFIHMNTPMCLVINIPKGDGIDIHKWKRYLPGLEQALDGKFWDGRNKDNSFIMEPPPLVFITCNNLPEKVLTAMTSRRWKINDISTHPIPHLTRWAQANGQNTLH